MKEQDEITKVAHSLAAAIARRDDEAIRAVLASDFMLRTPGGAAVDAAGFISGIKQIPGDIVFVKLEDVHVELRDASALVTGVQHAQVVVDGAQVDDRRPFVDWFVRGDGGAWRVKVAIDLPSYS